MAELWQKFGLNFEILTKDMIEAARSGNPFGEKQLLIARLDHLSRNADLQSKLEASDWDLVVVDEAHKMSAHYSGGEVTETKRYKLGRLAGSITRYFLLMTATPHTGLEADFHLFLALLDADRFEGKPRGATPDGALEREVAHGHDRAGICGRHLGQCLPHVGRRQLVQLPGADRRSVRLRISGLTRSHFIAS